MRTNGFAIAAMVFLLLGIYLLNMSNAPHWSLPRGFSTYLAVLLQVPCFLFAALFCLIDVLESIPYIPFSQSMVLWHFWLSLVSAAIMLTGSAAFLFVAYHPLDSSELGVAGTTLAVLTFASVPIFLLTQLWFVVDLSRAALKMTGRPGLS